jgi:hypothetical protein
MFCLSFYSLERIDTLQSNLLVLIKPSVAGGFFYIFAAWKRTSNIAELSLTIQKQELSRTKFIFKRRIGMMKDLMKVMKL